MTLSPDVIRGLPYVEGVLNYLAPMAERPMNLAYDPPPGVPRSTGEPEPHRVKIYDARAVAPRLSLDSEGLAVVKHDSAQYRYVDGELLRAKKPQQVRGLNRNHNHAMKEILKSTAESASRRLGPFQDFYQGLLAKGMEPELARLTLARKIAAIILTLWKKGERFDARHVKPQAA